MLALFETPVGYALFEMSDVGKLKKIDQVSQKYIDDPKAFGKIVQLKAFQKFKDTGDALKATAKMIKGKLPKNLSSFLQTNVITKEVQAELAISDKKLGKVISEKLGISCVSNEKIDELFRIIRFQFSNLVDAITPEELNTMTRGLSHGLSRYKIKFSTDKIDTMIIQAVSLIEDLDRELNNYMMRLREWYGWHFPELGKIVTDNLIYAKIVQATGFRVKIHDADLSEIIPEDISKEVKDAAEISMGSDITETDEQLILNLAQQIIIFSEYRATLSEYLKNRMQAVAPNLTIMVGELVGAKLIAHAGSLVSLAKCPASTIQIIGAEKSFFKALKTRHNTPKYGIIYQSALVGQAPAKLKGKISRALAAKTALCIRVDALCEAENAEIGVGCKEYLENRLRLNEKEILLKDEKFARRPPEGGARVKKPGELYGEQYNQEGDFNLGKVQPVAKTFVKGQTLTATHDGGAPAKRSKYE